MATYVLCPLSTFMSVFNNSGLALTNGLIWTYAAGTTTPTATYTDSTGVTPNSNPIQLTVGGTLNNVNIYQPAGTKIKVQFSTNSGTVGSPVFGTQIGPTFDNVVGIGDTTFVQSTYYGGTDTGSANAYVLNFSATFTSYTNGTIIYWIASNTNTGASTLNVNGLGALSIVYANGNALSAGQILTNQIVQVAVSGGKFIFLGSNITTGTATFTVAGITGSPVINVPYSIAGNQVILKIPQTSATSTAITFSMLSTTPALIAGVATLQYVPIGAMEDNGSNIFSQVCTVQSLGVPTTSIQVVFYKNGASNGWTNSGTKGIGDSTGTPNSITYAQL